MLTTLAFMAGLMASPPGTTHGMQSTDAAFHGGEALRTQPIRPQQRYVFQLKALRRDVIAAQATNGGVLSEADRAKLQARLDRARSRYLASR